MSRDYLYTTGTTWCPNQELGDAKGVWASNHALRLLSPQDAWDEETVMERVVAPTLGLTNFSEIMWHSKNPNFPMPPGNWVTISPAGISLEPYGSLSGGYSDGYSDILGRLDEWARCVVGRMGQVSLHRKTLDLSLHPMSSLTNRHGAIV